MSAAAAEASDDSTRAALKHLVDDSNWRPSRAVLDWSALRSFYSSRDYQAAWTSSEDEEKVHDALAHADQEGLVSADYGAEIIKRPSNGNPVSQVLAILLTLALVLFVLVKHPRMIWITASPMLVLTLAWFALSAAASPFPALAGRRLVLAVFTILQAAAFLLLPRDRHHFSLLLAVAALLILLVCYAGVLFAPELSIHQMSDLAEPDLAGDWRGAFTHKNGAGAAMLLVPVVRLKSALSPSAVLKPG